MKIDTPHPEGMSSKILMSLSIFKKKKLRDKMLNIRHKFEIKNTSLIVLEIPIMLEGENEHI